MTICLEDGPLCSSTHFAMAALSLALILAVVRLLRGPSTPDRVVALDLAASLTVGVIAVYSVMTDEATLLSGALIVALLAFLGTVAFARYLEKRLPL